MKEEQGQGGQVRWYAQGRPGQVRKGSERIRIEGGGRGGQTEDRQMEGMGETDGREGRQMEERTTEGGKAGWGVVGKRS